MKAKWYLSTLIIVFTLLGICHNQVSIPNQEISVQFNSNEVTTEQSQNAIATIKQQLLAFGVDNIQVLEETNGKLKITYHSTVDVESIKKMLSEGENLELAYTSFKHDNKNNKDRKKSYNLDIYEIHKTTDGNGSAGKSVLIIKQDFERFLNPNVCLPSNEIDSSKTDRLVTQASKVNKAIAISIDNTSHSIPEVRAGPIS